MADLNTLTIVFRNDTEERWVKNNPRLGEGEIVASLDGDTTRFKLGDGVSNYVDLPYTDLYTALKDGCMYRPAGKPFPWDKIEYKFLNDGLQEEVNAGDNMVLDLSNIEELFKGD